MTDDLVKQSIEELWEITRCFCHPAYLDRGRHAPECNYYSAEAVRIVADRIEELEAKLAKAVAALRGWIEFANEEGMPVLLSDLEAAELTGENT